MKFPYAEPLETGTAGFTLVDARIAWAFYDGDRTSREAFPDGGNLTNETARLPGVADQGQCATAGAPCFARRPRVVLTILGARARSIFPDLEA
jgi:hypothetical protein